MNLIFTLLFLGNVMLVKAQTKLSQDSVNYYVNQTKEILNKNFKIEDTSTFFKNYTPISNEQLTSLNFNEIKKALDYSEKLIESNPNRIDYFTTITFIYFYINSYENFINTSDRLLKQTKKNNNIWYNLNDSNKTDENILLRVYYPYIKHMLPFKNKENEFYVKQISEQFDKYFPNSSDRYLLKSWVENKLGNGQFAIKILEEGRKKYPNNLDLLFQLYEFYFSTKNNEKMNKLKQEVANSDNQILKNQFNEMVKTTK